MDILLTIGLCTGLTFIWKLLMKEQRRLYSKENLTMDKNSITITIDNYCGQKITFTASKDAKIETLLSIDGSKVVGFDIDVRDEDILIKKEDI